MNAAAKVEQNAIDRLWETLPPVWNMIRSHIRAQATGQFDLTLEQFQILRLVRRGKCTVSEVATARNISRPAVSQGADALVKRGLLRRSEKAEDRRFVELSLTRSGNDLLDKVFGETRAWMKERLAGLSVAEMQAVAEAMRALSKMLDQETTRRS